MIVKLCNSGMNLIFEISGSGQASPEDAPVYVGLGIVALGLLALVLRQQCYLAYQWIRPNPDHGLSTRLFTSPAQPLLSSAGSV
jgi:hypothetical protein